MKFKVLKVKATEGLYGVLEDIEEGSEIFQNEVPQLFGKDAEMEDLKLILKNTIALGQLSDYDLITVELTEVDK